MKYVSCFKIGAIAALAAATILLPACRVTTPLGPIDVGPRPTPAPSPGTIVGCWDYEGEEWCAVDTNGDGVPDFVYRRNDPKKWYPIRPPNVPQTGQFSPAQESELDGIEGPVEFSEESPESWLAYADLANGIDPPGSNPFASGTAEYWLKRCGLNFDGTQGGQTLNAAQLIEFDSSSEIADFAFFWSAAFGHPNLMDYALSHETFGLLSDTPGNPAAIRFRVAGNYKEVIRFVADCGIKSYNSSVDGLGYAIEIDNANSTAVIYDAAGNTVHTVQFR